MKENGVLLKISEKIVKYKIVVFVIFAAAVVYSVLSLNKVKTNSDISAFLPDDTETRRGIDLMEKEFATYSTARVMIDGVTVEEAKEICLKIEKTGHVDRVSFEGNDKDYKDGSALISVSFDGGDGDVGVSEAMEKIEKLLSGRVFRVSTNIGKDYNKTISEEMTVIIAIAAAVIAVVLIFSSVSYFEVFIFGVVFVVSAILNMGTNYWLGTISSITNSVAVILQLALAIDYAIILGHRYHNELSERKDEKEALIHALSKSIVEIASSGLTTVSGLAALTLMRFRLGYDLGTVLAKGIAFSMLTVFLLMPGLISVFSKPLAKTVHRNFIPDVSGWGRFLCNKKYVFIVIFVLILPFAVFFSIKTEYAFSEDNIDELVFSESRDAKRRIDEKFGSFSTLALIVPGGDLKKEKALIDEIRKTEYVSSVTGFADISLGDGLSFSDEVDAEKLSLMAGFSKEQTELVFSALVKKDRATLGEVALALADNYDLVRIFLSGEESGNALKLLDSLKRGADQLCGKDHDRIIVNSSLRPEDEEAEGLIEKLRKLSDFEYGEGKTVIAGDMTSVRDLRESYNGDSVLVSVLTVSFIFVILLFTVKSPVGALILVFVIQGSIRINFGIMYLLSMRCSFLTEMIVSAIQMGATIDYTIVIMNRYLANRKISDKKEAMVNSVRESFATVMTSGIIMSVAGFLIAFRVGDVYVGHMGFAVGRGALISMILTLTVLPQFILLFDKAIEKTTFPLKRGNK